MRALLLFLLLSPTLFAQTAPPPEPPAQHSILSDSNKFADAHLAAVDKAVGLSEEQKPKIRVIFVNEAKRLGVILNDVKMSDEQRQNSIQSLHLATLHQVAAELTPEQRQKFFNFQPAPAKPRQTAPSHRS